MKNIIKQTFQVIYKKLYNAIYVITRKQKIDKNKVIFVLSRGKKLEGNLKLIYEEMKMNYPTLNIHCVFAENTMNVKLLKELLLIKDAKYIILDDYYLPVYLLNIKSEVKVIQVWHAAGALKKFGYSTIGTSFGPSLAYLKIVPIHSNYTHVYVSSDHVKPFYAEAFNMDETRIHSYGIPRTEMFLSNKLTQKEIVLNQLKINEEGKLIILWAPTYRAQGANAETQLDMLSMVKKVMKDITKDVIVIYKPHPYSKVNMKDFKEYPNFILAKDKNIDELMIISDALITDYSSVIFDYSLLKRPFAHFVPDLEEYVKNRGFYEPIQDISKGIIIKELDYLIKWILSRKKNEYFETEEMIEYNFSNLENPTKKIINDFISES